MKGNLEISELTIRLNPRDDGTCPVAAWASFVVNEVLYLNNIVVRRHASGRFTLSYPVHQTPTASFPYFKPICPDFGVEVERIVMDAYRAAAPKGGR